jgi:hypothetical protein
VFSCEILLTAVGTAGAAHPKPENSPHVGSIEIKSASTDEVKSSGAGLKTYLKKTPAGRVATRGIDAGIGY